jgi:hypothetical protein
MPPFNLPPLRCPDDIKCETNQIKFYAQYATAKSTSMLWEGVIGGLTFVLAYLLSSPIQYLVGLMGITEPILNLLITVLIYIFGIVIIILVIVIPSNRKLSRLQQVAAYNHLYF